MSLEDVGLTAEEQAQFDSMRESALPPGSNIQSPDQITEAADAASGTSDQATIAAEPPAQTPPSDNLSPGEDDEDVETVRDATGKEVVDAKTGKPQKRVSFHKYQRAIKEMAELKKQLTNTAEERARIDERLKIINEALTTPPAEAAAQEDPDPRPDPEQNIFEYVKWQDRQIEKERQARQALETQWQETISDNNMANNYRQDASRFAASEPHFPASYQFLLNLRASQLRAANFADGDETAISQQVVKEEKGLVKKAFVDGVSPAKRIFEMARAAGFLKPTPPPPEPAPPAPKASEVPGTPLGNMKATPAPATKPPQGVPSVSEQVRMAAEGAAASTSLSQAGGAPVDQLTQQMLLTMDEDEFNAVVSRLPKSKLRELFGD